MIKLLPFRYKQINDNLLLINELGQYKFVSKKDFLDLLNNPEKLDKNLLNDLTSTFFLCENEILNETLEEMAIKLRTKKDFLNYFTTLHIIILSHNCNSNCSYCQASSNSHYINNHLNMSITTAKEVCKKIIQSPSNSIKIEFQGGEPTLNFETLIFIVNYMKFLNKTAKKYIEYILCTNLIFLNQKQINFIIKNNIYLSTSIDGPQDIHNKNRKAISDQNNFELVCNNIEYIQKQYGQDKVSALMTITKDSIFRIEECVDTYIKLNLNSIFFRPINPYGMAEKTKKFLSYSMKDYLNNYEKGLRYILQKNILGTLIREEFACIFLRKILTPFSNGFVDIQSPTGDGIGCAVYDIEGKVYVSDEARMLAKNQDNTFEIGNIFFDNYQQIFNNEKLHKIVENNIVEAEKECFLCPYIPYCGKDAVRKYQEKNLNIEDNNCIKHKGIIDILFKLILEDDKYLDVFWSWVTYRKYNEVVL